MSKERTPILFVSQDPDSIDRLRVFLAGKHFPIQPILVGTYKQAGDTMDFRRDIKGLYLATLCVPNPERMPLDYHGPKDGSERFTGIRSGLCLIDIARAKHNLPVIANYNFEEEERLARRDGVHLIREGSDLFYQFDVFSRVFPKARR
jgi:hypothetical protein